MVLADDLRKFKIESDEYEELIPPKFLYIHRINPTHQHVTLTYFAKSTTDIVKPEKVTDQWKWVTAEELETMGVRPSVKQYALQALKELSS